VIGVGGPGTIECAQVDPEPGRPRGELDVGETHAPLPRVIVGALGVGRRVGQLGDRREAGVIAEAFCLRGGDTLGRRVPDHAVRDVEAAEQVL